jgi:4'-phosphopantetheinyl transferase
MVCAWDLPPDHLFLPSDEVHVWRIQLDLSLSDIQPLLQILSKDELERAGRFHFERDRQHFITRRGWLRQLLGRYIDLNPGDLRFVYNRYGKRFEFQPVALRRAGAIRLRPRPRGGRGR